MATPAGRIKIHSFTGSNPLSCLPGTQVAYLLRYLDDLKAAVVVEEPSYFDRDYLSEFSAFYSISAKGYPNACRRLHFFCDKRVNRKLIRSAAGDNKRAIRILTNSYLGFVVIRPIPAAPLGRTVLCWYAEQFPGTPRVVAPSRDYSAHLVGITLNVRGLAWQQQDSAVGACATVGLWTMLHSSAFDDHHAIPTTADITRSAHRRASLGNRIFPSTGLNIYQICEAIKEQDLSPVIVDNDIENEGFPRISSERFSSSCAAFIRSAYPILLVGDLEGVGGHALCAVGFRSRAQQPEYDPLQQVNLEDAGTEYIYIHDDNLGPNVRFRIHHECVRVDGELIFDKTGRPVTAVCLKPDAPNKAAPCPTNGYPSFRPSQLIVAVHNDLRTSPDTLHVTGMKQAQGIASVLNALLARHNAQPQGATLSTRFMKLADYLGGELARILQHSPATLSRVRLTLCERVSPMSLHLGVVRIGMNGSVPLVDVLYDTTDSDRNHPVFAHVVYSNNAQQIINVLQRNNYDFGQAITAW